jgi:hypothetical protein
MRRPQMKKAPPSPKGQAGRVAGWQLRLELREGVLWWHRRRLLPRVDLKCDSRCEASREPLSSQWSYATLGVCDRAATTKHLAMVNAQADAQAWITAKASSQATRRPAHRRRCRVASRRSAPATIARCFQGYPGVGLMRCSSSTRLM